MTAAYKADFSNVRPLSIDDALDLLDGIEKSGEGWKAYCPVASHDNTDTQALSFKVGETGKLVLHCFAGCEYEEVRDALLDLRNGAAEGSNGYHTKQATEAVEAATAKAAKKPKTNAKLTGLEWWAEHTSVDVGFLDEALPIASAPDDGDGVVFLFENGAQKVRNQPKKVYWMKDAAAPPFWPIPVRSDDFPTHVRVAEGEGDATALMFVYGRAGVFAVAKGSNGVPSVEAFEELKGLGAKRVTLYGDADGPGQTFQKKAKDNALDAGLEVELVDIGALVSPLRGENDVTDVWRRHAPDREAFRAALDAVTMLATPTHISERFAFINLADLMEQGYTLAEELVPGWIVRGHIHWIQGAPGAGKTWLLLMFAVEVLRAGGRVAYFDEEMGDVEITNRLVLLGAPPDTVRERFDYLPFPGLTANDADAWATLCAERQWDLAIFDAATDFLAAAGLKENAGEDVTLWIKTFCEPIRKHGGTPVVADHIVKAGDSGGYAVGSRAKRAKAKVIWEARQLSDFDSEKVGWVRATREKMNVSATLPKQHTVEIGGTADGQFVCHEVEDDDTALEQKRRWLENLDKEIERVLDTLDPGVELSKSKLEERIHGFRATEVRERAEALAANPLSRVRVREGKVQGGTATLFSLAPDEAEGER